MDIPANGKPNLPLVSQYFKFLSTFMFIPFKWNGRDSIFEGRPKFLISHWIIFGPILTALHTFFSVRVLLKAVRSIGADMAWGNINVFVGFALASLLVQGNVSITAYGLAIARNYDEVLHVLNQVICFRRHLKGKRVAEASS